MAQLERPQRQVETSKSTPPIHTMEQLLRGESSKSKQAPTYTYSYSANSSSPSSPFFQRFRHHDSEDDHGQNPKKSVLTKVKEKAKKLRHSLSKRKHEDGNSTSPSAATALEGDGVEEDAEYLGAPMYESEKAPAAYKANARQHSSPRGNPISPQKHVMPSTDKQVVEPYQEKTLSRSLSKRTTTTTQPATTTTSPDAITTTTNTLSAPNYKTETETLAQKLTLVHAEKPAAAAAHITSKMQGLNVSKPTEHHDYTCSTSLTVKTTGDSSLPYVASRTPPAKLPSHAPSVTPPTTFAPVAPQPSFAPAPSEKNTTPTAQKWDKGVSVKEYFLNKLEPGEDEKALSQVISEAMSPRRTPGDAGVMEKVREAVTSLLRTEEPTKYANTTPTSPNPTLMSCQSPASRASSQMPVSTNFSRASSQMSPSANTSRASFQIPLSSNAQQDYEVTQEENHGRILQAN